MYTWSDQGMLKISRKKLPIYNSKVGSMNGGGDLAIIGAVADEL